MLKHGDLYRSLALSQLDAAAHGSHSKPSTHSTGAAAPQHAQRDTAATEGMDNGVHLHLPPASCLLSAGFAYARAAKALSKLYGPTHWLAARARLRQKLCSWESARADPSSQRAGGPPAVPQSPQEVVRACLRAQCASQGSFNEDVAECLMHLGLLEAEAAEASLSDAPRTSTSDVASPCDAEGGGAGGAASSAEPGVPSLCGVPGGSGADGGGACASPGSSTVSPGGVAATTTTAPTTTTRALSGDVATEAAAAAAEAAPRSEAALMQSATEHLLKALYILLELYGEGDPKVGAIMVS